MAEIIYMPKLSDTMTDGVVAEWAKKVGDTVSSGELLAEIETDKATMEFESFYDGTLLHIGVEKGQSAPVNTILAIIGDAQEDISSLLNTVATPTSHSNDSSTKIDNTPIQNEIRQELIASDRLLASPLAKKIATQQGIDIQKVSGTGDGGRIIKRDIDNFITQKEATLVKQSAIETFSAVSDTYTDLPISQMRKTIARRLAESKFSAPHFYLTVEINMDKAIKIRNKLNAAENVKISFNDLVVKASALSLRKHPSINSSWLGDVIRLHHAIHVGVAVAVEEGLLVPVIRHTDTKGLVQIGKEVRELAQKAKEKKLQPSEWEGNTFTISNLGMFGIDSFTAIINPPDSCILAVGGIQEVPIVKKGFIESGNVMKVTLSCDHRVVDGATGASFLQTLKNYLENPISMLL